MDEKETKYVGICHKLFDFVMKSLAFQALMKATLGNPTNHATINDQTTPHPTAHRDSGAEVEPEETISSKRLKPSSSSLHSLLENDRVQDGDGDERAAEEPSAQPKAPKKMVSINDRDEEICKVMKKRKKSRSFDKLISLIADGDKDEPPKPLRSILKAPSDLDDETYALANQNGN